MNFNEKKEAIYRRFYPLFLYTCSVLLVVSFVNMYQYYALFREYLGSGFVKFTPIILPLLLLLLLSFLAVKMRRVKRDPSLAWLFSGLLLCMIGLLVPDPNFPIKRIHVAEYLLLSLLVRYTLSIFHQGVSLLTYSCMLTIFFGIHDELLQGLHSLRTFGLRDITVNSLAAVGGNFIWYAFDLFTTGTDTNKPHRNEIDKIVPQTLLCMAYHFIAIILFLLPFPHLQNNQVPYWVMLPLLSASLIWFYFSCLRPENSSHGTNVLIVTGLTFLLYPIVINATQIPFH